MVNLREIFFSSGGAVLILLSLVEISPIKFSPWTSLVQWLGRKINADVIEGLKEVKQAQEETRQRLENHINTDEECMVDQCRARILRFNNELLRDIPHTKEEFVETLKDIDDYERYCKTHPDYANGRAVHAIANINRVYDERLEKHDFLV